MKQGETLALGEVAQVALTITDIDASIDFYRDTLGLSHMFTAGNMAFFDCGNLRLLLGLAEGAKPSPGTSILYFRVGDIEAAHNALAAKDVRNEGPPVVAHRTEDYELWLAFFRDPDGNMLALMEERATS
jgi:methylmalonyl-CoA/ethylmalonyl-CoA epimerase